MNRGPPDPARSTWRTRAARLGLEARALLLASRDPRVPWAPKLIVALVVAYALSPIDLIPDFIPVLGLIDDLVLVPAGFALAARLIPAPILAECRSAATRDAALPRSRAGALIVVVAWAGVLLGAGIVAFRVAR